MILRQHPVADVCGRLGRDKAFEIWINEKPVYSALAMGSLPDFDMVKCIIKGESLVYFYILNVFFFNIEGCTRDIDGV